MKIGIIGLGRIGSAIGYRLVQAQFDVIGYDPSSDAQHTSVKEGITSVSLDELAAQAEVIWLLVPAGELIDTILKYIAPLVKKNTIIIDAGNSNYKDSQRRAQELISKQVNFIDCGTSGGIQGKEQGFSLMIGGKQEIYEKLIAQLTAIAAPQGYGYVGPSGAGHWVKTVHNGIEYGLLQAYSEGFQVLRQGPYHNIDLAEITRIWLHGAVIRSWLLQLSHEIFEKDQSLETINGELAENGTGIWMVQVAKEHTIPVPVIEKAVEVRAWSRKTGGNFATKVIALLRHAFGGHPYTLIKK